MAARGGHTRLDEPFGAVACRTLRERRIDERQTERTPSVKLRQEKDRARLDAGPEGKAVVQGHRHLVHARPGCLESNLLLEPHGRRGNDDPLEQSGFPDPGEEIVRGEDALNVVARGPHAARWQSLDPEPVRPRRSAAKHDRAVRYPSDTELAVIAHPAVDQLRISNRVAGLGLIPARGRLERLVAAVAKSPGDAAAPFHAS